MPVSKGLMESLNQIRQTSIQNNTLYHKQVNDITPDSDISVIANPLLGDDNLMNEFFKVLIKRIVYTQVVSIRLFNSPLAFLEGEKMPLGYIGQEIFINPAKGRKFDVNDFAGLLAKYEADVKVQYMHLNSDIQYPVTITRAKLKTAFTTWSNLEEFINGISQSLYNGAYIDRYNFTKGLVASAYNQNAVQISVIQNPNTEALAKQFLTEARTAYLNMQEPTSKYNAWRKMGGYGRDVLTWTPAEDIVFLIRNDVGAYLDVNVLAQAFNIDKAELLGRIKYVQDFNEYDKDGNIVQDGSNILGIMCDKAFFRIKNQETTMDEFYNANNRTWQMYLNDVNMYQFSMFANALVFATAMPNVPVTAMEFNNKSQSVKTGEEIIVQLSTTPASATQTITYALANDDYAIADKIDDRHVKITGVAEGTVKLTATAGNITAETEITVTSE